MKSMLSKNRVHLRFQTEIVAQNKTAGPFDPASDCCQPKYNERLQELQKLGSWDRYKYIEKGGWDKMPGRKETTSGVAEACAEGLIALIKK